MLSLSAFQVHAIEAENAGRLCRSDLLVYIAFDGDLRSAEDHGMQYLSPSDENVNPDIIATVKTARAGYTVTVSLEFPVAVSHVYLLAPVVVAANDTPLNSVDAKVSLKVDGTEVILDQSAGPLSWEEAVGEYENSFRLYGGLEEGGVSYIPAGALTGGTKIEYTITLESVYEPVPEVITSPDTGIDSEIDVAGNEFGDEGSADGSHSDVSGQDAGIQENADMTGASDILTNGQTDAQDASATQITLTDDGKEIDKQGLILGIVSGVVSLLMIAAGVILSREGGSERDKEKERDIVNEIEDSITFEDDDRIGG